jgi:very-short-patch-repair endonuclease
MEILMQEITKKLRDDAYKHLTPMMLQLEAEGVPFDKIMDTTKKVIDAKVQTYYKKIPKRFDEILKTVKFEPDSKAEAVFYKMLKDRGITFQFHYAIGPYKADYLFNNFLVFEIDGAKHNAKKDDRRDKYMREMGYKVMRVPIWILAMNPEAILDEIQEAMKGGK